MSEINMEFNENNMEFDDIDMMEFNKNDADMEFNDIDVEFNKNDADMEFNDIDAEFNENDVEIDEIDDENTKKFRITFIVTGVVLALFIGVLVLAYVIAVIRAKSEPTIAPDVINRVTAECETISIGDNNILQNVNYVEDSNSFDVSGESNDDYNYEFTTLKTVNAENNYISTDENKIVDIYGDNKGSLKTVASNELLCSEKPVIYVYNLENEKLKLSVEFPGQISSTYPVMNSDNSWDLTAYSDSIFQDSNGVYYPYLFYEGHMEQNMFNKIEEGACVKGEDTIDFLYKTLTQFGMNDIECSDFITYWAPKMMKNPYNLISFQNLRYSALVPIKTDPIIDTQIRIYMVWQASDVEVNLTPQVLDIPNRPEDGTIPYLLEWGGVELGSSNIHDVSSKQISEMSAAEIQQEISSLSDMTTKANQRLSNLMAASSGIEAVNTNSSTGGYTFKDKNGKTTVFTTEEWQKLHDTWDYTGKFDEMVRQFTVDELKTYLNSLH